MTIITEVTQVTVEEGDTEILIQTIPDETIPGSYVTSHGSLTGLADNDHPQYLLRSEAIVTAAEVKTLYESNNNTNAFTDADEAKLDGIESGATQDQTAAEIKSLLVVSGDILDTTTTLDDLANVTASPIATYGKTLGANGVDGYEVGQKVWKDIIGVYKEDISGPTRPTKAAFRGSIDAWAFSVNDAIDYTFHMPHDYAVGTDIYLHVHWGHQAPTITDTTPLIWAVSVTYADRQASAPFSAFVTPISLTIDSSDTVNVEGAAPMLIGNYPQYCHVVQEIQLSAATPSATQLDTATIAVDGLIMVHLAPSSIPTFSGGTVDEPFLFTVDIHYQADIEGTKNRNPNFYT